MTSFPNLKRHDPPVMAPIPDANIMRPIDFRLLLSCLLAGLTLPTHAEPLHWETDFSKAQETARRENKPIFLLFTGSTWCGVCVLLEKKILSDPLFIDFAEKRLVPVKIDFREAPYHTEANHPLPPEDKANLELGERFEMNVGQDGDNGLHGYPSVFILAADGNHIGKPETNVNVVDAGSEPFVRKLKSMIDHPAKP